MLWNMTDIKQTCIRLLVRFFCWSWGEFFCLWIEYSARWQSGEEACFNNVNISQKLCDTFHENIVMPWFKILMLRNCNPLNILKSRVGTNSISKLSIWTKNSCVVHKIVLVMWWKQATGFGQGELHRSATCIVLQLSKLLLCFIYWHRVIVAPDMNF